MLAVGHWHSAVSLCGCTQCASTSRGWWARKRLRPSASCVPTEKDKSTLPTYTVEPPDILFIEAVRAGAQAALPHPGHRRAGRSMLEPLPKATPRDQGFLVDPAGRIDLGPRYGKVQVGGLTDDEAERSGAPDD